MLNSGKNFATKKKYANSSIFRKKNSGRKKNHNPPLQVKWSVPKLSRLLCRKCYSNTYHTLTFQFLILCCKQWNLVCMLCHSFRHKTICKWWVFFQTFSLCQQLSINKYNWRYNNTGMLVIISSVKLHFVKPLVSNKLTFYLYSSNPLFCELPLISVNKDLYSSTSPTI